MARIADDDVLIGLIKKQGGGGQGGTSNYEDLENKPKIAGTTLSGNKSLADLGIASASDLAAKQDALSAGDYIGISSGTIKVNLEKGLPNVYEYRIYNGTISDQVCIMNVDLYINGSLEEQHSYTNQQLMGNPVTIDDRIQLAYSYPSWTYTLLEKSNEHISGYSYSWVYNNTIDTRESFDIYDVATTLATKGDLDTEISAIKDGQNIDSFADVETALVGKQNALTAGTYIQMDNGVISVKRDITQTAQTLYYHITIKSSDNYINVEKTQNGVKVSDTEYNWNVVTSNPANVDDCFTISTSGTNWVFTNLIASTTQPAGYAKTLYKSDPRYDYSTTYVTTVDADKKLIIQSELDDAMATKQDVLTFDNVPTANSNNPVKSGGVKSAIDAAVASAYHHAGTKTCAELVAGLLVAANEGNVYNMTDSGTTTADFIEGAGQPIKAGDNVGVAKVSDGVYKFDLLSGFVDTTNFVQKSQTAGLLQNDGTVDTTIQGDVTSLKSGLTTLDNEVNGDATVYPYADVITIPDAVPANVADCSVKIEPVQDLHGQSAPYVGGAGKNILPLVLADIKTLNTQGTWNGNTYTLNGASFVFNTDNGGNITSITVPTGTTTGATGVVIGGSPSDYLVENTGYAINGCPAGGSAESSYYMCFASTWTTGRSNIDEGQGSTITSFNPSDYDGKTFRIAIRSGYTIPAGGLTFYPMLRLATETDATFAPYTNICPISGHTEVDVERDGRNRISVNSYSGSGTWLPSTTIAVTGNYLYRQANFTTTGGAYTFSVYGIKNGVETAIDTSANDGDISRYNDVSAYDYVRVGGYSNNASNVLSDVMLCFNDNNTDTIAYEPFKGKTYTIALGSTIYGGTVDFDSGVMTADKAIKDLGTLTWVKANTSEGKYEFQSSSINDAKYTGASLTVNKCSCFKITTRNAVYSGQVIGLAFNSDLYKQICVYAPMYADASEFTTAMNGQTLCYELATPTTIQLTPQQIQLLQGTNTLYASTGQISVTVNGVSGSIGALTEDVAELQSDLFNTTPSLRYTSATTGTHADKLAALQTAFAALTDKQKQRAYILYGAAKYSVGNWSAGIFYNIYYVFSQGETRIIMIDLSNVDTKMARLIITSSSTTLDSLASSEGQNAFMLYA